MEDFTFVEERTFTAGDNIVLNGTDSSSTNADSNLILEFAGCVINKRSSIKFSIS